MAYGLVGLRIALLMGAAFIASAGAAVAADRDFSIPPQSLSSALKAFADQSGVAILYRRDTTLFLRTAGVSGHMDTEAALSRLLDGSPFEFRKVERGYVIMRAPRPAPAVTASARSASPAETPRLASALHAVQLDDETALNELLVTGTSVRGVAPAGSAMIELTRDTLWAAAPTNIKEIMATVPQLGNFNANAELSTPNRFRNSGFQPNIHNLGIYATLTLLNGHRVAPVGNEGTFADPSTVPAIAVERVEMVADGASAIYGSDAVAGVVNFIYRKPFNGLEASTTASFDGVTSYRRRDVAVIAGHVWDAGGAMIAYEYSENRSPLANEIPTLALGGDQRARGGRDLRSNNCLTPNIRAVTLAGVPTGPTYAYPSFSTDTDATRCGSLGNSTLIPNGQRHAALATFDYAITDRMTLSGELNYGRFLGVAKSLRPGFSVLLSRGSPFFNAATIPPTLFDDPAVTQVSVSRSAVGLLSPTTDDPQRSTVGTAVLGLNAEIGGGWRSDGSLVVSATRDFFQALSFISPNATAAANDPNTATALNLFAQGSANSPATLARIDDGSAQRNWGQQRMQELRVKLDGPVLHIGGGEIRAAIGVTLRNEQVNQQQTGGADVPGTGFFAVVRNDHIDRRVQAGFAELNIPIVGEHNSRPGLNGLTLSLSGRYDHYTQYGGRFDPKYGLVYSPFDGLDLHASYGRNFAAPVLGLLTQPFGQPQYNTNFNVNVAYGPRQGELFNNVNAYVVSGGNPDLTPEQATTKSFGFDFAPAGQREQMRFGLNWYHVDYSNLVYKIGVSNILNTPAFASRGIISPSAAQVAQAIAEAPPTAPLTSLNFDFISRATLNVGRRIVEGLDLSASYRFETARWGRWKLEVLANRQLKYAFELLPGSGFDERVGTQDAVKWKTRYSAAWNDGPFTVAAFVNYIGPYANTNVTPSQHVGSFTTVDVTAAYDFRTLWKGATVQVRAANLLGQDPPFFDSTAGYNPLLATPFGRTFDVVLRARF